VAGLRRGRGTRLRRIRTGWRQLQPADRQHRARPDQRNRIAPLLSLRDPSGRLSASSISIPTFYGTTNNRGISRACSVARRRRSLRACRPLAPQRNCGSLRNSAHCCGVYGQQTELGGDLDARPWSAGIITPIDISMVGPMARYTEDLDLPLHALAGPDLLKQAAWRVELPPPRHRRLSELRVDVWASSPLPGSTPASPISLIALSTPSCAPGPRFDDTARPEIDDEEHQRLFMLLLRAATASRMRDGDLSCNALLSLIQG